MAATATTTAADSERRMAAPPGRGDSGRVVRPTARRGKKALRTPTKRQPRRKMLDRHHERRLSWAQFRSTPLLRIAAMSAHGPQETDTLPPRPPTAEAATLPPAAPPTGPAAPPPETGTLATM